MRWLLLTFLSSFTLISIYGQQTVNDSLFYNSDTALIVVVGEIQLKGNKVTRDKIIYREIEFTTGDRLSVGQLDLLIVKSRQNLINRSLFNFVTITKQFVGRQQCNILVVVTERWYIWPIPVINTAGRNINAWWENKDFGQLNYGIDLRVDNFRGRMEKLNFFVQGGYDQTLAVHWTIPYLTKSQYFGIGVGGGFQGNSQIAYAAPDNKLDFYYSESGYVQTRGFASLDFTFRPKYNYLHTLTLGFDHYKFRDTLLTLNPAFSNGDSINNFLSLAYQYKLDFRDYKPYPLDGYYFDVSLTKQGFGLLGQSVDYLSFSFTFDQYIPLYKRWFFAWNFTGLFSNSTDIPFYLSPAFGYLGMEVRGYELYIVNGQNFGLFKSNIKFEIIPKTTKKISWIKTEKFGKIFYALYANVFFDLGYASDQSKYAYNPLSNQLLWGTGLGLDFITYYDLVIRFEYTVNKQGEYGFFLNLVAPI